MGIEKIGLKNIGIIGGTGVPLPIIEDDVVPANALLFEDGTPVRNETTGEYILIE